jgi:hypothetical protein
MLVTEVQPMATQGEGIGEDGTGGHAGKDGSGAMHGAPRHRDDPWYQPESGVPRDEDADEHPPLSEDD